MNKFLGILLISFVFLCGKGISAEESAVQILRRNFKKVEILEGNLSITMNDSGRRYLFKTDGKDGDLNSRVLAYGETVVLDRGFEKAAFIDRHLVLRISRLGKAKDAYELRVRVDLRSTGKESIDIKTQFLIKDKSIEDEDASPQKTESTAPPNDSNPITNSPDIPADHEPDIYVKPSITRPSAENASTPYRTLLAAIIAAGIIILYIFLRIQKKRL